MVMIVMVMIDNGDVSEDYHNVDNGDGSDD